MFGLRHAPGEAPANPDWYYNLLTNPEALVEVGINMIPVRARLAQGEERERIWERQKRVNSVFADYERKATRPVPVVILEPRGWGLANSTPGQTDPDLPSSLACRFCGRPFDEEMEAP